MKMRCKLVGIGASGPGFQNLNELTNILLADHTNIQSQEYIPPKPSVIPPNERRRAPLPVKIAVEVSEQAVLHSGLAAHDFACVFGSGLGDTQITDYMCRALNSEAKLLSPTKFHNSVHNAAAGYWTISTRCMQAANSIAAYHETVGMCLLEAAAQIEFEKIPVLMTVYDIQAYSAYRQIFECDQNFGAALALLPISYEHESTIAELELELIQDELQASSDLCHTYLDSLFDDNPSAKILSLLAAIVKQQTQVTLRICDKQSLQVQIRPC